MKRVTKSQIAFARGLRWGRLLASINGARTALSTALGEADLLDDVSRDALVRAASALTGVDQRAWTAADKERQE